MAPLKVVGIADRGEARRRCPIPFSHPLKKIPCFFNVTRAAEEKNAENLLVIRDKTLAAKYSMNWREHAGHSGDYSGKGGKGGRASLIRF
jgi:hypothetical protein